MPVERDLRQYCPGKIIGIHHWPIMELAESMPICEHLQQPTHKNQLYNHVLVRGVFAPHHNLVTCSNYGDKVSPCPSWRIKFQLDSRSLP